MGGKVQSSLFHRGGNQGTERLSGLSTVTLQVEWLAWKTPRANPLSSLPDTSPIIQQP